jgi:hypothetical protein
MIMRYETGYSSVTNYYRLRSTVTMDIGRQNLCVETKEEKRTRAAESIRGFSICGVSSVFYIKLMVLAIHCAKILEGH